MAKGDDIFVVDSPVKQDEEGCDAAEIKGSRRAYAVYTDGHTQRIAVDFGVISEQEELIPQITEIHKRAASYFDEQYGGPMNWYGVVTTEQEQALHRAREDERQWRLGGPVKPRTWHVYPKPEGVS